jgi:acetyl esterase/lipase
VVVYYHGGGWVIADLETYDASARALAREASAIVVSSHYRQAPEHKFPAAHQDAFAAYEWVVRNGAQINGDPRRVAVAGESAGGNLAANVAIMARDRKIQAPLHQILVYPVAGTDMNTPSYVENAQAKPLNKPMVEWFVGHALRPQDMQSPMINLVAADLRGLPPATVITAEIDPLRSEGMLLAERLRAAGVEVTARDYEGVTHEFFGMDAVVPEAKAAQNLAGRQLVAAFTAPRTQ